MKGSNQNHYLAALYDEWKLNTKFSNWLKQKNTDLSSKNEYMPFPKVINMDFIGNFEAAYRDLNSLGECICSNLVNYPIKIHDGFSISFKYSFF